METIIAGSRTLGASVLRQALTEIDWTITRVVCGCAGGIDRAGWEWAREHGVPVIYYPAWPAQAVWAESVRLPGEELIYQEFGYRRGAGNGYYRNALMARKDRALLAVWDGHSSGTRNMITVATKLDMKRLVSVHKQQEVTAR